MDSYQSLCMLILMRLKSELEPFGRLRLHKAAMFVEVFSRSKCFKITDDCELYYSVVDNLSEVVRQYQTERSADTDEALPMLNSEVSDRVKESYTKSIPYILQSSGFVNSIADNDELTLVSAVCGFLKSHGKTSTADVNSFLKEKGSLSRVKDLIATLVNLEKSGIVVKDDFGYKISDNLRDVSGYVRVI